MNTPSRIRNPLRAALGCLLAIGFLPACLGEILVQPGESIAFLGDSITKQGAGPNGWCGLVVSSLESLGINVRPINAGRGGHTSRDMAGRFEADVIEKKATWMVLMCGTNDNPGRGLSLQESAKNITTIVEKTQAAGIKVVIATRPMRGGDMSENDYNAFIHSFAKQRGIPLADTFDAMRKVQQEYLKQNPTLSSGTPYLTIKDGTHLNPRGNQVIAECILAAFGATPEQRARIKESWPNPDTLESLRVEDAQKP